MNAVVETGIAAKEWTEDFDSCWIDFTKGLGAPVGAVLAGSHEFIEAAWRVKQQIGGAMRQSGVIAAMCLYALDHHVDRLADDHTLARSIAQRIAAYLALQTCFRSRLISSFLISWPLRRMRQSSRNWQ
jgi:threonine aldolase